MTEEPTFSRRGFISFMKKKGKYLKDLLVLLMIRIPTSPAILAEKKIKKATSDFYASDWEAGD